ncbi:unnamed protein product [Euphydryas editha]|uniref:DDE-1 domain-containing protein n=1 Tax=Euphydryas editha TaxID=104508 RepID=A0AAU9UT33_EUPED|nr:unnamed protein product [Euphydryas editha]
MDVFEVNCKGVTRKYLITVDHFSDFYELDILKDLSAKETINTSTASGEMFAPYVVYKADNLWTNWCANGPDGARYNRTKSGWFDKDTFQDWFNTIIIPWAVKTSAPKVLIGDNLSSHLNINMITKCEENNIRFYFCRPIQRTTPNH